MKRIFIDMDGTVARFNTKNSLIRYDKEIHFFEKLLPYANIDTINELAKTEQVYIISASPHTQADKSKMKWLDKYLPNITKEKIIFCRLGENKAKVIEDRFGITIDSDCILIDDYTKNLIEWCNYGGTGIKRLTTVSDNSRKLWKHQVLKDLKNIKAVI